MYQYIKQENEWCEGTLSGCRSLNQPLKALCCTEIKIMLQTDAITTVTIFKY